MDLPAFWKKLNYKDQTPVCILNAPDSFQSALSFFTSPPAQKPMLNAGYSLVFCQTQKELDAAAQLASSAETEDALFWVAYPKKASRNYTCEFDRDHGWNAFGAAGFEGVRMVAIDGDWSALRMRKVAFIKSFTRNSDMILSVEGRARKTKTS